MDQKNKRILATICTAALLLNVFLLLLYYWPHSKRLAGDEGLYIFRAIRIVRGLSVESFPLWPPGYAYFLSAPLFLAKTMGFPKPILMAQLLQIVLWAVTGIIFWKIASQLLQTNRTRILALSLFMLNPTLIAFSHYFWPEIPHLAVYLLALWLLVAYPTSTVWNGIVGILLAVAALLKLIYLPVSLFLIALIFIIRFSCKQPLVPAIISPLLFVCMLAPTLLHNLRLHNKLMIADSSIFNIWVGLNDRRLTDWHRSAIVGREFRSYMKSAETHNERNEIYLRKIKALLADRGLLPVLWGQIKKQYFRLFDHRTFFAKQLPGGMKQKYRFSNMYVAYGLRGYNAILWGFTLLGFGIGLVLSLNRPITWMHLFIGIVFYNIVLFLVLHVKTRYVIQFFPMLCLISSVGLNYIWERVVARKAEAFPGYGLASLRIVTGVLLSTTLLALGFRSVFV